MKQITLSLLLLLLPFTLSHATAEIDVLFSGEVSIRETFLKEIETLSKSVDLALPEVTSGPLTQVLVKAKERGVKVRVVTDSKQARMKSSRVNFLVKHGISIKTIGGTEKGAMSHHFAILDGKRVITGPHDWTGDSGKGNYENILIIHNADAVNSYQNEFDRLWREKRVVK